MIKKIFFADTDNTYPYRNLAVEEYLTLHARPGECTLFLWQNRKTVVIGRNQNCWKECRVGLLEKEGGYLVRRLSGGGAVFHDAGNLNFTFAAKEKDYDEDRQTEVILRAVRLAGIRAEKTGRNDLTASGRKFSGNAFYRTRGCRCHHGTIILKTDIKEMERYLDVEREKLISKGVGSVRSRVVNLSDLVPGLTVSRMKKCLKEAFAEVYGLPVLEMEIPSGDEINALEKKFASAEWKYGRRIPFSHEMKRRFPWGSVRLLLNVEGGIVREAEIYSDAMEEETIRAAAGALRGCRYDAEALSCAVTGSGAEDIGILGDIAGIIRESFL